MTRVQELQAALEVYRKRFRTATPLERSVLLMAMRAVMDEMEELSPKRRTPLFELCRQPTKAA